MLKRSDSHFLKPQFSKQKSPCNNSLLPRKDEVPFIFCLPVLVLKSI